MSKPLRVGLIGAGRIAHSHMTAYLEHPDRVQLVAVCDIIEPAARAYAKEAGVDAVYTDYAEMLRETDLDAVDICSSHDQHWPQALAAAAAGKHALVEKSMAHNLPACREMLEAADNAGVTLMVAQNQRYATETAAVKRFIDEGNLGDIQAVRTHAIMAAVPINPRGHWMNDGHRGGGVLLTNTIHHVDLLRYYIGNVKRVTGVCKAVQPEMVNGAEDLVAATLEFENGAVGDVFGSWTTSLVPEGQYYMVVGSKGTLHSTPPPPGRPGVGHFGTTMYALKSPVEAGQRRGSPAHFAPLPVEDTGLPTENSIVNEILHFEECCRTGAEPISSGRDNLETMKVIAGIQESSRAGKAVDLDTL